MPNVMVALPNIGGALCSTPQSLADVHFYRVPQSRQQISAVNGPKFTIWWGHVEEILLFNTIFPIVNMCLSCDDMARQICAMVRRWRIFASFLPRDAAMLAPSWES